MLSNFGKIIESKNHSADYSAKSHNLVFIFPVVKSICFINYWVTIFAKLPFCLSFVTMILLSILDAKALI